MILEEAGVRTYYACDGSVEYVESGGSTIPQWSKTYIHLGARLLSTLTPNGSGGEFVQYHHPDRLGTRLVTNAQDTNYYEQVTLPFGTALNAESSGSTNRRFTTYDRSLNTGLDYALNRHYDPQQGRFTQVDPIGMGDATAENPQSFNLYAYCGNDPINYSDPSGLGFFSFLKKLFKVVNTIIKWLKVALAVALIAVTIWLAPMLTGVVIAKLLVSAGLLLGQTLGPRWMQTAITIGLAVVGIYLRGPQAIWNFSSSGSPAGGSRSGMAASVGAVTGFMAIAGKKKAGKQSKAKKPALQTVAVALLQLYNPLSKAENREYAGSICENPDGSLFGTVPNTADGSIGAMKSSTSTPCPSGSNRVGTFHTHGTANPLYDDENFSLADRINANNRSLAAGNSVPNFVATPSGTIKRFDPAAIANSARGRVRTLGAKAP